jgi:hypothetical protein
LHGNFEKSRTFFIHLKKMKYQYNIFPAFFLFILLNITSNAFSQKREESEMHRLISDFKNPPASAHPGVYWYFMDGWMNRSGIKEDLESMKKAGIGRVIFLEVNVGIPKGPVNFLSKQWYELFVYAVAEGRRLGIAMTLGVGPGWAGSGGPWITAGQSMQELVAGSIQVSGSGLKNIKLPLPSPKKPYFGERTFTPELKKEWSDYYKDVVVLAFPTPEPGEIISDINEKALYYREPFSSVSGVKPFLPSLVNYPQILSSELIKKNKIINLTDKMQPDGTLTWLVPPGNWTIMRFVSRSTGALTRPAPEQGMGFESSKMDTTIANWQLESYVGKILNKIDRSNPDQPGGLKTLHLDSWEMGAQNWTPQFRKEFIKRRGYDPLPFYPTYAGEIVESLEISNRFLWDMRETCNELMLENYAKQLKKYAHRHGLNLSIEPYDMDPNADLELGSIADIPMGEFWSKDFGYNTSFSCIEATSVAHIQGAPIVQGEAFTSDANEAWKQYPGSMKNQGDWAFATGINRFYFHTFAHKPFADSILPGMTMGPYGVHWDRKQTWWPMVSAYHSYISRCQYLLQQGKPVADILYLTPEGAPQVFQPPASAMTEDSILPDRKGYNFDGCSPEQIYKATVKNHSIVFPSGASYHLLVLPDIKTMTPRLLKKITLLVQNGAIVEGPPPLKSPGLSNFPECDDTIKALSLKLWGELQLPDLQTTREYGKGKVIWDVRKKPRKENDLYPDYDVTAAILNKMGVQEDFRTVAPIRYTHRTAKDWDIYFVSNRTNHAIKTDCIFHTKKGTPQLWHPITGKIKILSEFSTDESGNTTIPLKFEAYESYFIVFANTLQRSTSQEKNFPGLTKTKVLNGQWIVSFNAKMGGSKQVIFDSLTDWKSSSVKGIKYYSGIAEYKKSFNFSGINSSRKKERIFLNLGEVKVMAHVWLNGKDLGILWTAPWRVDVTESIREGNNQLKICVANLWPNRLIGDQFFPDDGIKNGKFPDWFLKGEKRMAGRYAFSTYNPYTTDSALFSSGLLGPVVIQVESSADSN